MLSFDFETSSSPHVEFLRVRVQPYSQVKFGPGGALGDSVRIIDGHPMQG
jgi:hypothetical protein